MAQLSYVSKSFLVTVSKMQLNCGFQYERHTHTKIKTQETFHAAINNDCTCKHVQINISRR